METTTERNEGFSYAKSYLILSLFLIFCSTPFLLDIFPWKPSLRTVNNHSLTVVIVSAVSSIILRYEGAREENAIRVFNFHFSYSDTVLFLNMGVFSFLVCYFCHIIKDQSGGLNLDKSFERLCFFILLRMISTVEAVAIIEGKVFSSNYFQYLGKFCLVDTLNFCLLSYICFLA